MGNIKCKCGDHGADDIIENEKNHKSAQVNSINTQTNYITNNININSTYESNKITKSKISSDVHEQDCPWYCTCSKVHDIIPTNSQCKGVGNLGINISKPTIIRNNSNTMRGSPLEIINESLADCSPNKKDKPHNMNIITDEFKDFMRGKNYHEDMGHKGKVNWMKQESSTHVDNISHERNEDYQIDTYFKQPFDKKVSLIYQKNQFQIEMNSNYLQTYTTTSRVKKAWQEWDIFSIIPLAKLSQNDEDKYSNIINNNNNNNNNNTNNINIFNSKNSWLQSDFLKYSSLKEITRANIPSKYFILTPSLLLVYRSKESVIHLQSPLQKISLFNVITCDTFEPECRSKNKKILFYFYIKYSTHPLISPIIHPETNIAWLPSFQFDSSISKIQNDSSMMKNKILFQNSINGRDDKDIERINDYNSNPTNKNKFFKDTREVWVWGEQAEKKKGKKMSFIDIDQSNVCKKKNKNGKDHLEVELFNNSEVIYFSDMDKENVNRWVCVINYLISK